MGRIIYIYLNTLYSFDPSNNKLHKLELDGSIEDSNTMYISNENIILKKEKYILIIIKSKYIKHMI